MNGEKTPLIKKDGDPDKDYGKLSIEESFELLDEIIEKMEDEDITLEESFAAFEEGMKVLKSANSRIDEVEKKVRVINENGELDEFQ
ncbi:MAG: exodeoxyribonuclease VII small subunit [Lachnospiraceae bacterium]|nr:exodeoxyribonuclease VII small subunit [Lachnospiraceae bacterium]